MCLHSQREFPLSLAYSFCFFRRVLLLSKVQVIHLCVTSSVEYTSVTAMIFRISFSDVFHFTLNVRKGPLIPEGFVLETPPKHKPTSLQRQPGSPTSHSILPSISQSPVFQFASPVSETPSGSTETLVNIIVQPVHLKPILILHPSATAHEGLQTRRISFADSGIAPCSRTPTDAISMGQVTQVVCKPSMTTEETLGQGDNLRENMLDVGKKARRKSLRIRQTMSLLVPRAYCGKARRFSVPTSVDPGAMKQK